MEKVAIMTDTNSGITPSEAEKLGIELMSMPVFIDNTEYFEYININQDFFFERMAAGAQISTSQPSPGMMIEMWDRILKNHDTVVYIPMSSGLSGTVATAKGLAAEYEGRVFVVDNKRISVTLYESVLDALYLRDNGKTAKEISDFIEQEGKHSSIYVTVNTLEYLKRSGRVTAAGAAIGTVLGIKPVLTIQGGKLDAYKKVRGIRAAAEALLDGISEDLKKRFCGENIHIRAAYSGGAQVRELWEQDIKKRFPDYSIEMDVLPISISCHVGPGALGIGVCRTIRK